MKVVILAGGLGTRLSEETEVKPKPMVEIGGRPILWHIMKHYAHHGFKEFVIALGYKGEVIKRYFLDYAAISGSMTVHLATGRVEQHESPPEDWTVQLFDTGLHTLTGGRVKRLQHALGRETFMVTYGDGVCNVDLGALLRFHQSHGKLATVTAVRPPARFGGLVFDGDSVASSRRSRRSAKAGSTGASSSSSRGFSTTWRRTARAWRGISWSGSRATGSSRRIATTASGSAWTRCAT